MLELLYEVVRPVNLPFTLLMGVVIFYWILVGLGAVDLDTEASLDMGDSADIQGADAADAAAESAPGVFKAFLQFLNFGNVPAMIIISIMALSLWTFSLIANHYFNSGSVTRAMALLLPNILLTLLLTKVATAPLKKFFDALNRDYEEHKPVVGRTCVIVTSEVTENFGQAQIETSGAPLLINVRSYGDAAFIRGESALIIKEDKENQLYTIAKLKTPETETSLC